MTIVLLPVLLFGLRTEAVTRIVQRWPVPARLLLSALLCVAYVLVSHAAGSLRWSWVALYAGLPVAVAWLLHRAAADDPSQRGNWRDAFVLLVLGLAVDLRWFEPAWPAHLGAINKLLLLDAGLYGFLVIRQIGGMGFDLRPRWEDARIGLRELAFCAPVLVPLGFALGFSRLHLSPPSFRALTTTWGFTFAFIAIPEEVYFRGWIQNLLERRLGRRSALLATSAIFGLAHFNKGTTHFNWRYVLMATLAGVFYGRAWQAQRRVLASAITHASVDAIWSLWLF